MKKSESIKEIATAFAKFQAEVSDPQKTGVNPFFNGNRYVQLDGLLDCVRPVLSKHGLSIMQEPSGDGQLITISTILLHSSGEWMEFEPLTLKAVKADPQGAGSAITYGRRYALSAILGVAWDEDDDGNKASNKQVNTNTSTTQQKPTVAQINEAQRKRLAAVAKEKALNTDDMKQLLSWKYKKASSAELTTLQADYMINNLDTLWSEYVASQSAH